MREENNTKNCIIQTLLENQKNCQNTSDLRRYFNHNESKSTNHFILPKKRSSNIKPTSSNQKTKSNTFGFLSQNSENSPDAKNVISVEDRNMLRVTTNLIMQVLQLREM